MKQLILNDSQTIQPAIHNQLLYLNQAAIAHLERKHRPNESIHQARLCFKRCRAMLRLVRPGLEVQDFEAFNAFYRQCGQALGQMRDTTARLETIQLIGKSRKSPDTEAFIRKLVSSLAKAQRDWKATGRQEIEVSGTIAQLSGFEERIRQLSVTGNAAGVLKAGIRRLYRQGRKRMEALAVEPDDAGFHQLRKSVKYLGYVFESLQYLYPAWMKSQMNELVKLGRLLGSHHDLVILLHLLDEIPAGRQRTNLRRSIIRRKKRLEKRILADAALVYLWKPSEFAGRVGVMVRNRILGSKLTV